MNLDFDKTQRKEALEIIFEKVENYYSNTNEFPTSPDLNLQKIRTLVQNIDIKEGNNPAEVINHITKGLEKYSVHTPHPKYFGLFNPRSNFAGILADIITATYNPQLAAWSHAPFAVEVEAFLIKAFAEKYGYNKETSDGVFTTGGAEANLTAVLCALNNKYSQFAKEGLFGLDKKPIILCSEEAHHSIQKAAKIVGLGYDSVKVIPTESNLKMDIGILKNEIESLKNTKNTPLMVIGTAGTTGTGTVDYLTEINTICKKNDIWFHVDAAYGGAVVMSQKLKQVLNGVEFSDSITFDAHKWMSVPMGTSIFLTPHNLILGKTFRITTEYMPKEANKMEIVDPFSHSIQWSRRFIGLKVYLSLLIYGWKGYEKVINYQKEMGDLLKNKLIENGWIIKNDTELPVVCFTDSVYENDLKFCDKILNNILNKGNSWLSVYPINGTPTFRACITNYKTSEKEIHELVNELNQERKLYSN